MHAVRRIQGHDTAVSQAHGRIGVGILRNPFRSAEVVEQAGITAFGLAHLRAERSLNYFREAWLGPSEALLVANRVSSYLGKLDRLKLDSLKIDSKDAQSVVAGSGRLRRNYDVETDRDLLAKMIVNFTKHVPREMWGEQLTEMYDAAGGDADRMAREAFDASFCSDPDRYDA